MHQGGTEEEDWRKNEVLSVRRRLDRIADRMSAQGLADLQMYRSMRQSAGWLTHVMMCEDCLSVYIGGTNG